MKATFSKVLASLLLAGTGVAGAQPVTMPDQVEASQIEAGALGVEILDPDAALAADTVRGAIGAELGVRIVGQSAYAPALGRLEIAVDRGTVRIAYHPSPGTVIERTLALPIEQTDRTSLIAFVATNLVRDQASEVLGGLPVLPPPAPLPAARLVTPTRYVPATIGLVPPLTIDRAFGERVTVGFGLHAVMGWTDNTNIATISGVVDVVSGEMYGAQIGGALAATLGHARGLQLGGAVSLARGSFYGAQIGGAAAMSGGTSTGIQVGGAAAVAEDHCGIQVGGAASIAKRTRGIQIGGAGSVSGPMYGLQIGGAANVASRVDGAQIAGAVNIGGDVHGLQIGVVNIARKMRGVQIGVVNLSDDGDDSVPIGVINYSKNGGIAFDGWVDSSRVTSVGFRHGTKYIHNIWSIGWSPDHDNVLVGAGLGATARFGDLGLDIDAMHWLTDIWDIEYGQINQLRASLSVPLAKNFEAFGGVAANVYITDRMNDNSDNFHPTIARTYEPTDSTKVVLWPTAFVGLRVKAK
ncbi:MAG: LA_2272 family surface repeat-containing protein [Kofleriaceae bacterium]